MAITLFFLIYPSQLLRPYMFKPSFSAVLTLALSFSGHCQETKDICKNWIVVEIADLKANTIPFSITKGNYQRYSFDSLGMEVCGSPLFGSLSNTWSLDGDHLKLAMAEYKIELLTDSAMVIVQPSVLRTKLVNEAYLACHGPEPKQVDAFEGNPVYEATQYLTPHCEWQFLKLTRGVDVDRSATFLISFIVTDNGEVKRIQVLEGVSKKADKQVTAAFAKTNRQWSPATFCGRRITTLVKVKVKFNGVEHW